MHQMMPVVHCSSSVFLRYPSSCAVKAREFEHSVGNTVPCVRKFTGCAHRCMIFDLLEMQIAAIIDLFV